MPSLPFKLDPVNTGPQSPPGANEKTKKEAGLALKLTWKSTSVGKV